MLLLIPQNAIATHCFVKYLAILVPPEKVKGGNEKQ